MSLSFFSIAGLWALLALFIPLLIHLFNRSRGRLVRIGHIDLVRQARRLRVTEVKLAQWLLLLLRMMIFALAALMVAGLAQTGLQSSNTSTSYVSPEWIRTAGVDALAGLFEQNQRILVLQANFASLDRALADEIRQTSFDINGIRNISPLLAERLSLEKHDGEINVYAVDYLSQFGNSRTSMPYKINWHLTNPATPPALNQQTVSAVIVYAADRRDDAAYIRTALASIKAHRLPNLTYRLADRQQFLEQEMNVDWLFLLSGQQMSSKQLSHLNANATVLMDAGEGLAPHPQQWITLPFYPFSTFTIAQLAVMDPATNSSVLASTNGGRTILQQTRMARVRILQFGSRFNPAWSSLVQQPEFPELLLRLMQGDGQQAQSFAHARINQQWLQQDSDGYSADIPLPRRSLQSLLAMLLVLLWIAERWLSERKNREPS